jgi:two-component system, NarL family, response regulator LiaR
VITICVIEDLPDYRDALCKLINKSPGLDCVGAYGSTEEAMASIIVLQPDVALVDIQLPGKNGIELVKFVRKNCPNILCMMCTAYDEDEKVFEALEAGAHGYVLKSTPPVKIIEAIDELVKGGSPMSTDVARKVVMSFKKNTVADDLNIALTEREKQVLELLAKGLLYKEIAAILSISSETVRKHCFNIYQKLHVNNRTEAINKFYR